MTESTALRRNLLIIGIGCLILAIWSILQGEIRDALLGVFLATVLLLQWRYRVARTRGVDKRVKETKSTL